MLLSYCSLAVKTVRSVLQVKQFDSWLFSFLNLSNDRELKEEVFGYSIMSYFIQYNSLLCLISISNLVSHATQHSFIDSLLELGLSLFI